MPFIRLENLALTVTWSLGSESKDLEYLHFVRRLIRRLIVRIRRLEYEDKISGWSEFTDFMLLSKPISGGLICRFDLPVCPACLS